MLVDITSNYENFKIIFHRYSVWHKNYLINVEDRYIYNKLWSSNSIIIKSKTAHKQNCYKVWIYMTVICTLQFWYVLVFFLMRNLMFNDFWTTIITSVKHLCLKMSFMCELGFFTHFTLMTVWHNRMNHDERLPFHQ